MVCGNFLDWFITWVSDKAIQGDDNSIRQSDIKYYIFDADDDNND